MFTDTACFNSLDHESDRGARPIVLPVLSAQCGRVIDPTETEVYARFMRHLGHVPCRRAEIQVLASIQFTADMLGLSDAEVAKILVDQGLRAPRLAFPADFLRFAGQALMRTGWDVGGPSAALKDLKAHWDMIGEDRFADIRGGSDYAVAQLPAG